MACRVMHSTCLCTYRRLAVTYLQYLGLYLVHLHTTCAYYRLTLYGCSFFDRKPSHPRKRGREMRDARSLHAGIESPRRRPEKRGASMFSVQSRRPEFVSAFSHWLLCPTNRKPCLVTQCIVVICHTIDTLSTPLTLGLRVSSRVCDFREFYVMLYSIFNGH